MHSHVPLLSRSVGAVVTVGAAVDAGGDWVGAGVGPVVGAAVGSGGSVEPQIVLPSVQFPR